MNRHRWMLTMLGRTLGSDLADRRFSAEIPPEKSKGILTLSETVIPGSKARVLSRVSFILAR
jgi:hypothetical protein